MKEVRWGFWQNPQNTYFDYILSLIFTKNMRTFFWRFCVHCLLILWFSSGERLNFLFWSILVICSHNAGSVDHLHGYDVFFYTVNTTIAIIMLLMWHYWTCINSYWEQIETAFVSRYKQTLVTTFVTLKYFMFPALTSSILPNIKYISFI